MLRAVLTTSRIYNHSKRIHTVAAASSAGLVAAAAAAAYAAQPEQNSEARCEDGASGVLAGDAKATLRLVLSVAAEQAGLPLQGGLPICEEEFGYLYTRADGRAVDLSALAKLQASLDALVAQDVAVQTRCDPYAAAQQKLKGQPLALQLLETRLPLGLHVNTVSCHGATRLAAPYGGDFMPSLGALKGSYQLEAHPSGGVLLNCGSSSASPSQRSPSGVPPNKTSATAAALEVQAWGQHQKVASVADLNNLQEVSRGRKEFMLAAEYRQEARLRDLVREIQTKGGVRVVCIAGPTSSGKTTFAAKLCAFLGAEGISAHGLTVDHYYLPLNEQPRYQARQLRSDVDYDHIESMDVQLVNAHIAALVRGEAIEPPVYNMKTGYRDAPKKTFQIPEGGLLVIEGIHALNPLYTQHVPNQEQVFKVFLSPQPALQVDDANVLNSKDVRLLRRMARDYLFRGHSASKTLGMWANVQRGEGLWIFPFQGEANHVVNSAHEYDISVLKPLVEPLLRNVPPTDPEFAKAQSLLQLLDTVHGWGERDVPTTSLLREFLGNGAYDEH